LPATFPRKLLDEGVQRWQRGRRLRGRPHGPRSSHGLPPPLNALSSCSRPWRDLSDNLKAIQHDQDVTGLDALAASRTMLEEQPYAFHGRLLQRNLAASPRPYGALMWSLVQLIAMLEKET